jgi:hypothetical protein
VPFDVPPEVLPEEVPPEVELEELLDVLLDVPVPEVLLELPPSRSVERGPAGASSVSSVHALSALIVPATIARMPMKPA